MSSEWGRIADDGTVYLRTDGGERVIGSWQAGTPEEGLAFYVRRYDDLAADVRLLEGRIASPASDPAKVADAARTLRAALPEAAALGDLAALDARLGTVLEKVGVRRAKRRQDRAAAAVAAAERKGALVAEAEQLATSSEWRVTGERFRAIVEQWKAIRGVDRTTDSALWEQFAAARRRFDSRRRAHFSELDHQRAASAATKQELVVEAEKLASSTDWVATARAYRDLMARWKSAGRGVRENDDEMWQRFRAAQDTFFGARTAHSAERDQELSGNLEAKQALLAEAESLDASSDPEGARRRLRAIHDRWEKVGHVPRAAAAALEDRLAAVEKRIRETGSANRQVTVTESPIVIRLRESVTKLEARLARAQRTGDEALASETDSSLRTQREWLAQAERSSR